MAGGPHAVSVTGQGHAAAPGQGKVPESGKGPCPGHQGLPLPEPGSPPLPLYLPQADRLDEPGAWVR